MNLADSKITHIDNLINTIKKRFYWRQGKSVAYTSSDESEEAYLNANFGMHVIKWDIHCVNFVSYFRVRQDSYM